jgi:small subunit ribosomal protein S6
MEATRTLAGSNRTLLPTDGSPGAVATGPEGGVGSQMRPYEVVLIFDPGLEESAVQAVINRSTEVISSPGGTVSRVDKWGRRRLAYEIGHRGEGYYVLMAISADPGALEQLDRLLHLADDVIRHKIIRVPQQAGRVLSPSAVEGLSVSGNRRNG